MDMLSENGVELVIHHQPKAQSDKAEIDTTRSFLSFVKSPNELERLWALKTLRPNLFGRELVEHVLLLLCDASWAVTRQAVLLLQGLGREGRLGEHAVMLQRLFRHPRIMVRLLVARILEHVPEVPEAFHGWQHIIRDRNLAYEVVKQQGLALEFLAEFQEDREIVSTAVRHTGEALQFAASLARDEEIVLEAVRKSCAAAHFVDEELVGKRPALRALKEGTGVGLWGNYVVLEQIGEGSYVSVWRAESYGTQEIFAIKKMHLDQEGYSEIDITTRREISLLRLLSHPNVVQLKEVLEMGSQDFRLVLEFLPTDLFQVLKTLKAKRQKLPMELIRKYSSELLEGLHACHAVSVMHRDLKPQNLLLSHEGSVKIADFGLGRVMNVHRRHTQEVIVFWYRPPELLLGAEHYGLEVDLWSVGCILAEMAIHCPLFPGDAEVDTLFKIFRVLGSPSDSNWPCGMTLPHWSPRYPKWETTQLQHLLDRRPELQEPLH